MLGTDAVEMKKGMFPILKGQDPSWVIGGATGGAPSIAIPQCITRGQQTALQAFPSPGGPTSERRARPGSPRGLLTGLGANTEWGQRVEEAAQC